MNSKGEVRNLEKQLQNLKQENQRLKKENARYHEKHRDMREMAYLVEQSADSIIQTDKNFRINYMNSAAEELFAWKFEEIAGKKPDILNAEKASDKIQKEIYDTVSRGDSYQGELLNKRKDGSTFFCHFTVSPIKDSHSKITGYMASHRDISERKQAQLDLQKSEQKYKNLIKSMTDIIILIDGQDRFVDVHCEEGAALFLPPEEFIGKKRQEVLPAHINRSYDKYSKKVMETGKPHRFEYPAQFDGEDRWFIATLYLYENKDGILIRIRDITDRKQAEIELAKQEESLRTTLNSIGDAVISTDLDGNIVRMNPLAEDLTGWKHKNAQGKAIKKVFDIVNAKTGDEVMNPVYKVLDQGKIVGLANHTILKSRDGKEYQIADSGAPIKDKNGNTTGVVLVFRDVTEQYEMRQALYRSEKKYREIFNNANDAIFLHKLTNGDSPGEFTEVNDVACDMLGYSRDELIGKSPGDIETDEDAKKMPELIDQLKQNGHFTFEIDQMTKNGNSIPVEVSSHIFDLYDEKYALSIARDITERKEAREKLENSMRKYKSLFEQSLDGIFLHDLEGNIIDVNQVAAEQSGYSRKELLEMEVFELHTENTNKEEILRQWQEWDTNQQVIIEDYHKNKDGSLTPMEIKTGRVNYGDKELMLAITRDISARRKAEEEKDELQEQLLQSQKLESIGTLAGGVAHDFNNILTVIIGLSQMILNQTEKSNSNYQHLKSIDEAARRAADLTRNLLLFSRKQDMDLKNVNLSEIIDNLNKMLNRLIGEDIQMHNTLPDNLWEIEADQGQIEQVITNLVVNARDAMPDGGHLSLSTQNVFIDKNKAQAIPDIEPGQYVMLSIEDTGHGIDKSIQDKIFDPFFTTKGRSEGTGMGLSVVHGIIKEHGGLINVYSESGQGTIFKIYLPVVESKTRYTDQKIQENMDKFTGNGEKILIVEDEIPVLQYLENVLTSNNYITISAKNAEEALQIYEDEKHNIDLMISDVIMTGMDGVELADHIRSEKDDLKIILSSGYSDRKVARSEIRKKDYSFIQKPYDVIKLLKIIHETLN
ncbi:MAG TPA: PAS domain S-box protein [bacterium]|nr:PAS domain S-box protein [bacterium]